MADQHIKEISDLNSAFAELSRVIPTTALEDYQKSLNTISILHQKTSGELEDLGKEFERLSKGTSISKSEFAKYSAEYASSTNRLSLSLDQFQKIAVATSKIDPFNTSQRIKSIEQMTKQYGSLTSGLANDSKRSETALRLMNLALQQGDESMAGFFQTMARGATAQDNFASKQEKVVAILQNTKLGFSSFIGESKQVDTALNLLNNKWVSMGASLAALGLGIKLTGNIYRGITGGLGHGSGAIAAGGGVSGIARNMSSFFGAGRLPSGSWQRNLVAGTQNLQRSISRSGVGRVAGRLGWGGGIAIGLGAAEAITADNTHDRAAAIGGTVGSLVLGAIGTAIGGPVLGIGLSFVGNTLGRKVAEMFTGPVVKTAEQLMDEEKNRIAQRLADKIRSIQNVQGIFSGVEKEKDPLFQEKRDQAARMDLAQKAAGMGLVGPGAQIKVATEQVAYTQDLMNKTTKAYQDFKSDTIHSQEEILSAEKEYTITMNQLKAQQLGQVNIVRRSIMEQFTAASINAGSGTYSMPGTLSDRQKYGGSYMDYMPLENISGRKRTEKYGDLVSKFMPILKGIASTVEGGRAGGGLIPGAPSSTDNRVSAVASGEYVINSSAVSHYGSGLFDALNNKSAPRFAAGGMMPGKEIASEIQSIRKQLPWYVSMSDMEIRAKAANSVALRHVAQRQVWEAKTSGDKTRKESAEANINLVNDPHFSTQLDPLKHPGGFIADTVGDYWYNLTHGQAAATEMIGNTIYGPRGPGETKTSSPAELQGVAGAMPGILEAEQAAIKGKPRPWEKRKMKEWEGLRMPTQKTWHPNFGVSPFGDVKLGGRGMHGTHDFFSESVFGGGNHSEITAGAKHPAHRNESNTPEIKKLDTIHKDLLTINTSINNSAKGWFNSTAS